MAVKRTIYWGYDSARNKEIYVTWREARRFAYRQAAWAEGLPNGRLLSEVLAAVVGDQSDGSMSAQARLTYGRLCAVLQRRLLACGYLEGDRGYRVPPDVKQPTEQQLEHFCALFETVDEERAIRKCVRWLLALGTSS